MESVLARLIGSLMDNLVQLLVVFLALKNVVVSSADTKDIFGEPP
jgi:hypothetical protein